MNNFPRLLAVAALSLSIASPVLAQHFESFTFDPSVVRVGGAGTVALRITTSGNVTALKLDLLGGAGSVSLAQGGGGWTASIPVATLTAGYTAAEVNRHLVGFVHLTAPGVANPDPLNLFISVIDANVPRVTLGTNSTGNLRVAPHVVNILNPNATIASGREAPINGILGFLGRDAYDFVDLVYALPSYRQNRYHGVIRNDVSGIGIPIISAAPGYSSQPRLKGFTMYPIETYFDAADLASNHELGHQWINSLPLPALPGPHWPPSTMARRIMGVSLSQGDEGGSFPWDFVKQPNGTYQWGVAPALDEFSDLDLYLMGLIDSSAVGTNLVAKDKTKEPCIQCPVEVTTLSVADVIAAAGARNPGAATSQKVFRIGTVIATRDRLLNDDELTLLDWFSARGEAKSPLPSHSGMVEAPTNPFYVATKGHGSLNRQIEITDRVIFARTVTPSKVPAAGGTTMTVTGYGFAGLVPITISVDGVAATGVNVTTFEHVLTFIAPPHKAGAADVVIKGQIGSVRVPAAMTYQ